MKLKNHLTAALLASTLLIASNGVIAGANANTAPANKPAAAAPQQITFTVKKYDLIGFTGPEYVDAKVRAELVTLLNQYVGNNVTPAKINELKNKLQATLNQKAKGIFTVSIPRQVIRNGVVVLNVNFVASKVIWGSAKGYTQENVENSLPSLREGVQFVAGRPFVDERELTMAVENPLKLTQIQYDLNPGQPVTAHVNVSAPQGNNIRFFQLDNYGPESLNYVRGTLAYLNGNLTGKDDVLQLVFVTNFKNLTDFYALQGSYSYPFYAEHQRLDVRLGHASTSLSDFKVNTGSGNNAQSISINAAGAGYYGGADWSYYLPHYNFGYSNQIKVNAGFNWKRNNQSIDSQGQTVKDSLYYLTTYHVGVNGKVVPKPGSNFTFDLKYNWFYAGHAGTSDYNVLLDEKNSGRVGMHQFEYWLTGNATYSQTLPKNWNLSTSVGGQYTSLLLYKPVLFSINMRDRSGQGGASGDIGLWFNAQLTSPNVNFLPSVGLNFYGFYDAGVAHYNHLKNVKKEDIDITTQYNPDNVTARDNPDYTKTSSSIGLGANLNYRALSLNAYTSYLLTGFNKKDLDFTDKSRFSFYISGSVRF